MLYAPVATEAEFINAIAYLIRRLDENTGVNNFLRHVNGLRTETQIWRQLQDHFQESVKCRTTVTQRPHRTQNRLTESIAAQSGTYFSNEFTNEPNTDWSLAANRQWAKTIRLKWKKTPGDRPMELPLVVAGDEVFDNRETKESMDPNQLPANVIVARYAMGSATDIEAAVATAKADPDDWRQTSPDQRHRILSKTSAELRMVRGDLIGAARSFSAGSAWDFASQMGPLIRPPQGELKTALTELEPEESWALKSESGANNPRMWTAAIKWNVRPGSSAHMTEFFGPLLGVMRVRDLAHAVALVNQSGYGLTSGLQSLDRREQERWKAASNCCSITASRVSVTTITAMGIWGSVAIDY